MMLSRIAVLLALATAAHAATTISLQAVADTHVSSANASTNYGNAGALAVSGSGNANGPFQSLLRFDLSSALAAFDTAYGSGNWTLESLALQVNATTPNNSIFNANAAGAISALWLITDSWVENAITWNTLSTATSGGTQSMGSFSYAGGLGTTSYALSQSAGFGTDLSSGSLASLLLTAADPSVSMVMNSRNFTTVASRPHLILTAVPEPTRLALLALSLVCLSLHRSRPSTSR
jgi:hypothetical protein